MMSYMRRQFVLDSKTNELLEELAADRAGNRSFVVREALQFYAAFETRLDEIERDPGFLRMMERSANDIREGRTLTTAEVKKRFRTNSRKKLERASAGQSRSPMSWQNSVPESWTLSSRKWNTSKCSRGCTRFAGEEGFVDTVGFWPETGWFSTG